MTTCNHILSFHHDGAQCRRCRFWIGYETTGIPERILIRRFFSESDQKRFMEGESSYWGRSGYASQTKAGITFENGKVVTLGLQHPNPITEQEERRTSTNRPQTRIGQWRLIRTRKEHYCNACDRFLKSGTECYSTGEKLRQRWACLDCVDAITPKIPEREQNPAILDRLRAALKDGRGWQVRLKKTRPCQLCNGEVLRGMVAIKWRTIEREDGKRKHVDLYVHPECS